MDKNEFKIVAFKILKFAILLLVVDFTLGFAAQKLYFAQKTGKQARIIHTVNDVKADLLIFGSSHANRHYVPSVFDDELNLSSYNAGVQGQKIIFQNALQSIVLEKNIPKTIILNIDEDWLFESEEAYDKLSDLYPFYWQYRDKLKPIFTLREKFTDVKLFFKAYQTNSTIAHIIKYAISAQPDEHGYRPLYGIMDPADYIKYAKMHDQYKASKKIDPNFVIAFTQFIKNVKKHNSNLLLVLSPTPTPEDYTTSLSMIKMLEIAKKEQIPVFDYSNDERFMSNYPLFNDGSHLNDDGAKLFSKIVAQQIKSDISKP